MTEITCKRCGLCCHYYINGIRHKCKYLVKLPNNKTSCRIYHKRLGTVIHKVSDKIRIICKKREDVNQDYEGCPYNKVKEDRT